MKITKSKVLLLSLLCSINLQAKDTSFSDIIKNTELDNHIRYRLELVDRDYIYSDFDYTLKTKSSITDNILINTKIKLEAEIYHKQTKSDDIDVDIDNIFLDIYDNKLNVRLGKLNLISPFADGVTVYGADISYNLHQNIRLFSNYLVKSEIENEKSTKMAQAAVLLNFKDSNYEFWYSKMQDRGDFFAFNVDAKVGVTELSFTNAAANYANKKLTDKPFILKGSILFPYKFIETKLEYAIKGDKRNDLTFDNDSDARTNYRLWQLDLKGENDAYATAIDVSAQVYPKFKTRLAYANGKLRKHDIDEILAEISYTHSKKLSSLVRVSKYRQSKNILVDDLPSKTYDSSKMARIEINYKF